MTERQRPQSPASARAWSYIAGEKGRNRVRVFERIDREGIWIDYRDEHGKRYRNPLGHADRERAKLEADDVAAKFGRLETAPTAAISLAGLIDIYEREVSRSKSKTAQAHDRRTFPLFVRAFGAKRRPGTLSIRDLEAYIQQRRRGTLAVKGREGKPVRARVLEQDCNLLNAVLNWATRAGDGAGGYLLERNPLKGLAIPREESPRRAVLTEQQFESARQAAAEISSSLELFVCMAWYTGHRSKSIRMLQWADLDLAAARVHWRGENDKIDYDHWNPLHPDVVPMLRRAHAVAELTGDVWVFPSARDAKKPLSGDAIFNLWKRVAVKAGIPNGERYGWHSFRRRFANALRNVSLRDLKDLGGWKSDRTVVSVYQQPSEEAQRQGLQALGTKGSGSDRAPGTGTDSQ